MGFPYRLLALWGLKHHGEAVWRFSRLAEWLFSFPAGQWAYCGFLLSCLAFPFGLAYGAIGRVSVWRWGPAVIADIFLSLLQFVAIMLASPARY